MRTQAEEDLSTPRREASQEPAWLTPWFWTSSFQNWEPIIPCLMRSVRSVWTNVPQAFSGTAAPRPPAEWRNRPGLGIHRTGGQGPAGVHSTALLTGCDPLPEGPLRHHQKWHQGVRAAAADWAVNQVPMPPTHPRDGGLSPRPAEEAGFPGGALDVWESQATLWTPLFCPRGHCRPEPP